MNRDELVRLYPNLYHLAEDGSWPSIEMHGLLSTERLLDLFEVDDQRRDLLMRSHRPDSVQIEHPIHGVAVVRDQKPISVSKLKACLDDMTITEWFETLNQRVFFWLQEGRLDRMLNAPPYRTRPHTVLVIDTARIVQSHGDAIRLSHINTGATLFDPPRRGPHTFTTIEDYLHPNRRRALAAASDLAELAVLEGVPDIVDLVVRVERRRADAGVLEVIWEP